MGVFPAVPGCRLSKFSWLNVGNDNPERPETHPNPFNKEIKTVSYPPARLEHNRHEQTMPRCNPFFRKRQYAAFRTAIRGLLHGRRPPFAAQKEAYGKPASVPEQAGARAGEKKAGTRQKGVRLACVQCGRMVT